MTAPMIPPAQMAPQPMQPPVPPPIPFQPRPNDTEPLVAMAIVKRLSRLMFDPRYSAQPPEWQQIVNDKYMAARQALMPAPVLPKGVVIQAKPGDASALAADEQAAATGQPPKPQQPSAPKIPNTGASPITAPSPL